MAWWKAVVITLDHNQGVAVAVMATYGIKCSWSKVKGKPPTRVSKIDFNGADKFSASKLLWLCAMKVCDTCSLKEWKGINSVITVSNEHGCI